MAKPAISWWLRAVAVFACLFGALTLFAGGKALFGGVAGNVVPVVLWFNFLAGGIYILAGIGLYRLRRWSVFLSLAIAVMSVLVLCYLAWHILEGRPYELRTVLAMTLRTAIWAAISYLAWRSHGRAAAG
jgi:hypothetical protein